MAARQIPATMKKLIGTKISANFREATSIVSAPVPQPGPSDVLVHNKYVGINASDINYTAGRYIADMKIPYDLGFEGIGEIVVAGKDSKLKVGQVVAYTSYGAFADYKVIPSQIAVPLPAAKAEFLSVVISGLTAALGLSEVGEMKKGETVLVTAAAGGTGQFAVQLAKEAGCHVIGTCSSAEKVDFLKSIGCDRPVNYTTESLKDVLAKEYPKGLDVVYESIGGDMFKTALDNMALKGRLIVIGFISQYEKSGSTQESATTLPRMLLTKSSSVRGFFLPHYFEKASKYLPQLLKLLAEQKIKAGIDYGNDAETGPFVGLEKVADAIEYMYKKKNKGKIVVELSSNL